MVAGISQCLLMASHALVVYLELLDNKTAGLLRGNIPRRQAPGLSIYVIKPMIVLCLLVSC